MASPVATLGPRQEAQVSACASPEEQEVRQPRGRGQKHTAVSASTKPRLPYEAPVPGIGVTCSTAVLSPNWPWQAGVWLGISFPLSLGWSPFPTQGPCTGRCPTYPLTSLPSPLPLSSAQSCPLPCWLPQWTAQPRAAARTLGVQLGQQNPPEPSHHLCSSPSTTSVPGTGSVDLVPISLLPVSWLCLVPGREEAEEASSERTHHRVNVEPAPHPHPTRPCSHPLSQQLSPCPAVLPPAPHTHRRTTALQAESSIIAGTRNQPAATPRLSSSCRSLGCDRSSVHSSPT